MNNNLSSQRVHRTRRQSSGWVGGIMLIGLGALLLLQNTTGFYLNNWWALFILLPALGAFTAAYHTYRETGRINGAVRASLVGGIVLCLISAAFLFSLDWTLFGPALLLLAGVSVLVSSVLP